MTVRTYLHVQWSFHRKHTRPTEEFNGNIIRSLFQSKSKWSSISTMTLLNTALFLSDLLDWSPMHNWDRYIHDITWLTTIGTMWCSFLRNTTYLTSLILLPGALLKLWKSNEQCGDEVAGESSLDTKAMYYISDALKLVTNVTSCLTFLRMLKKP